MACSRRLRWMGAVVLIGMTMKGGADELPAPLIQSLASDDFKARETGEAHLLDWARNQRAADHGGKALGEIWNQYRVSPDPEVRERCLAVLRALVTDQYLSEGPGFLGIERGYGKVTPPGAEAPKHAVLVTGVRAETPASRAGVQMGDMIVNLDGTGWVDENCSDEFAAKVAERKPGTKVKLGIVRGEKWLEIDAVLMRRPSTAQILRFGIPGMDAAADERAAIDSYFKDWLSERILRD
ncbi:MAG: PDZ domain-containing protein [Verrucomicrobiota bacterium]